MYLCGVVLFTYVLGSGRGLLAGDILTPEFLSGGAFCIPCFLEHNPIVSFFSLFLLEGTNMHVT